MSAEELNKAINKIIFCDSVDLSKASQSEIDYVLDTLLEMQVF